MLRAGWAATRDRRRRYAVAQVHSLPDFLVFATMPLRIVGVPVILDLHEAMPELFRIDSRAPPTRSSAGCSSSRNGCRSAMPRSSSRSTT